MTNACIVTNCMSGVVNSGEKVYLFHVPLDEEMQKKWALAIPQTKEPLNTDHLVCDKHFLESDICRYHLETDAAGKIINKVSYEYPKLTDTAVPSIFPGYEVRLNGQNNAQPQIVQNVQYYQDPTSDVLTDIAYYSALNNLTSGHCHHHYIGSGTSNQFSNASTAPQPAAVTSVVNADPVSNGTSTTIPSVQPNQGTNPTDLDLQTVGLSGNSNVTIPQDTPIGNPTEIAATVQTADLTNVSVDIPDHSDVVNSVLTQASAVPEIDSGTSGLDAVTAITSQPSGWNNVIVNEPVSSFPDASTPFVSSAPKPADGHDGCCGDDDGCCGDGCCGDDDGCCGDDCCGDDCCGDDCCGDDCCGDDCGDCDCDDCVIS